MVPGRLGDDHPFGPCQSIDQGGLAGIGPTDHRDLHLGVGGLLGVGGREHFFDQLQQLLLVAVLVNRDGDRLAAAQLVKLGAAVVKLGNIGLIHHQDDRRLQIAKPLRHLQVQRHQLVADIDDEEDQVGLVHCRVDLALDILAQVIAVDDSDAAGIEKLDEPGIRRRHRSGRSEPTRSRVTPAIGSTMAIRRPASQLKTDDLPTLGRPTITTLESAMSITTTRMM